MARSGWAIVKQPDSYLIVSAGYHSKTHKHADDLSFCLYDQGTLVVTEVGKYGYDEDETRAYALSNRAHNIVLVDGKTVGPDSTKPYGSGIRRTAANHGWFAIEAQNQPLQAIGIDHRRLFVFKPGLALVVLDELRAETEHTYTRLIHLGQDIEAETESGKLALRAAGFAGWLYDAGTGDVETRVVRGQTVPEMKGWTFPDYRSSHEIFLAELESSGRDVLLSTVVALTPQAPEVEVAPIAPGGMCITLRGHAFGGTVQVAPAGDTLTLTVDQDPMCPNAEAPDEAA
jgi:hypothetical protein